MIEGKVRNPRPLNFTVCVSGAGISVQAIASELPGGAAAGERYPAHLISTLNR